MVGVVLRTHLEKVVIRNASAFWSSEMWQILGKEPGHDMNLSSGGLYVSSMSGVDHDRMKRIQVCIAPCCN